MNLNKKYLLFFIYIFIFISVASGDVIKTKDGMILNGKIIKKTRDKIVFSNYYGTFTIELENIKKIHETKAFTEDVKVFENMGVQMNSVEIKRNFEYGEKKKNEEKEIEKKKKKEKPKDLKLGLNLFFSPQYYANVGRLSEFLPHTIGLCASLDFYMDRIYNNDNLFIPDFRTEVGYTNAPEEFSKMFDASGTKRIDGPYLTLGPIWPIPLPDDGKYKYEFHLSALAGFSSLNVQGRTFKVRRFGLNITVIAGFTLYFKRFSLVPDIRFNYIYDGVSPLYSIGFGIGFGAKIL